MKKIIIGDVLESLKSLPNESVQMCVTSPPYWGLRDYGTAKWDGGDPNCDHLYQTGGTRSRRVGGKKVANASLTPDSKTQPAFKQYSDICKKCGAKRIDDQIGLEKTPEEYVQHLVEIFREVRRVLRPDGVVWLNLGDSYAGGGRAGKDGIQKWGGLEKDREDIVYAPPTGKLKGIKAKDLVGIPWMTAFALRADGWYLRSDVIWHKPNPMPESVTDRCTKSHEYIFLLTKSARYYYDAEAIKEDGLTLRKRVRPNGIGNQENKKQPMGFDNSCGASGSRNKRSVWDISTKPYHGAHFATFPPELPALCILAGTSEKGSCSKCGKPWVREIKKSRKATRPGKNSKFGTQESDVRCHGSETSGLLKRVLVVGETTGWKPTCNCNADVVPCVVLDAFAGSGTTLSVAKILGRDYIGIELNPQYLPLMERRIQEAKEVKYIERLNGNHKDG